MKFGSPGYGETEKDLKGRMKEKMTDSVRKPPGACPTMTLYLKSGEIAGQNDPNN